MFDKPLSLSELIESFPEESEPVVDGLVRRGESINVIASPKVGKTWLVHGLARSIALGEDWLGFGTRQGRVLIVDAELQPKTLSSRLNTLMGENIQAITDSVQVWPMRGQSIDAHRLHEKLVRDDMGDLSMIIVDALYRFLPKGVSENDNSAMMGVYNVIDSIAAHTGAAVAVVHHSSKGNQSGKSVTDVGSGASAIARAADTHLSIRKHKDKGCAVLEGVCRSFVDPDPITIEWEYPQWRVSDRSPQLETPQGKQELRQKQLDNEADVLIRKAYNGKPLSISQLRKKTGMGGDRIGRSVKRLGLKSKKQKNRRTGKSSDRYFPPESEDVARQVE